MNNDLKLTDLQQACLLLVRAGKDHEIHRKWVKQVESLEKMNLIQLKPNTTDELMLTLKGEECLSTRIVIKYPLHNKGSVGSYNSVVRSMGDDALNALACAMMAERVFERIPKNTLRVLGQHFLDTHIYKQWGSVLLGKWLNQCKTSMKFFADMDKKKNERRSNNNN